MRWCDLKPLPHDHYWKREPGIARDLNMLWNEMHESINLLLHTYSLNWSLDLVDMMEDDL